MKFVWKFLYKNNAKKKNFEEFLAVGNSCTENSATAQQKDHNG